MLNFCYIANLWLILLRIYHIKWGEKIWKDSPKQSRLAKETVMKRTLSWIHSSPYISLSLREGVTYFGNIREVLHPWIASEGDDHVRGNSRLLHLSQRSKVVLWEYFQKYCAKQLVFTIKEWRPVTDRKTARTESSFMEVKIVKKQFIPH